MVNWKKRTIIAIRYMQMNVPCFKDCTCEKCADWRGLIKIWKLEKEFNMVIKNEKR